MGCRAGLWNMDISKVTLGLQLTNGAPSHPEGALRAMFIRHGQYVGSRNGSAWHTIDHSESYK